MTDAKYGITKNLGKIDFDAADKKVRAALKEQGFGIITEIDVKATLKEKIGEAFRNYKILGACNPPLAHKSLTADLMLGLLLPCNVIVFEEDDGTVTVSALNPKEIFSVLDNPAMGPMAQQVESILRKALAQL